MPVKTEETVDAESSVGAVYAVVNGIDSEGEAWKEAADVFSYTSSGVGLYLPRSCTVGTLISLMLNYPPELRCYDHEEEFYRIWGVVQHCHLGSNDDGSAYQIGIGFIGDDPPATYGANPLQNYRISGMSDEGLWNVSESSSKFVQRKEIRYWQQIDLYLALVDARRETLGGERVVTENISKNGAAVITSLELNVGDRLKIISQLHDFSSLAVVCNLTQLSEDKARVSLQFVEGEFPIEQVVGN